MVASTSSMDEKTSGHIGQQRVGKKYNFGMSDQSLWDEVRPGRGLHDREEDTIVTLTTPGAVGRGNIGRKGDNLI